MIKFDNALSKKYEKQLENFSEDEFRKLEELKELFEFLDDIIPLEDDEDEPPKKGRKRYALRYLRPFFPSPINQCHIPTPMSLLPLQPFHECCYRDNDDERHVRRSHSAAVSPE